LKESFLNGRVILHAGDCLDVLATLPENSVDSVVCDPPYHLTSIVKRFGGSGAYGGGFKADGNGTGAAFARMSRGFMGKQWDGGDIAFQPDTWRAVMRVLKPGGHLVAFSGTRTYHRMACAIEDAGFEIRDCLQWLYGSGFPKSHNVSKGIDKAAGAKRGTSYQPNNGNAVYGRAMGGREWNAPSDPPATDSAREWQGWGTALKPACEPICLARKPLSEKTVASNVLRWGTGAINVDGCRVSHNEPTKTTERTAPRYSGVTMNGGKRGGKQTVVASADPLARWPANLVHDGSEEVLAGFPESDSTPRTASPNHHTRLVTNFQRGSETSDYSDSGSAARFFYTAKADASDRIGSKHPTVKPVDLICWLVRLVTPKGGTCLDPFSGTGTTGEAAFREGMNAILIEREEEYQADIRRRMALCLAGPEEKQRAIVKAKGLLDTAGPLFA
jgi:DNA modification methylase